jgi:hypothetical protein
VKVPALAAFALAAGLSIAAAAPASAGTVRISVKAVSSCTPKRVNVTFQDGTVHRVTHVTPGPRLTAVTGKTKDLYIVARIHASWSKVTGGAGHMLRLTADGPATEQWTWRFRLRSAHPLADPTNYVVCLHPLTASGSFVKRMHQAHGAWRFTTTLTTGRYTGSHGATTVQSRP